MRVCGYAAAAIALDAGRVLVSACDQQAVIADATAGTMDLTGLRFDRAFRLDARRIALAITTYYHRLSGLDSDRTHRFHLRSVGREHSVGPRPHPDRRHDRRRGRPSLGLRIQQRGVRRRRRVRHPDVGGVEARPDARPTFRGKHRDPPGWPRPHRRRRPAIAGQDRSRPTGCRALRPEARPLTRRAHAATATIGR